MRFRSILFDEPEICAATKGGVAPEYFSDLNLDQIVESITSGRDEYKLKPFFNTPLRRVDTITYRHEILRDLENPVLSRDIGSFALKMQAMRKLLSQAEKRHHAYQKQREFLNAVEIYCDAVSALTRDLALPTLASRGFLAFREYLISYTQSLDFTALCTEVQALLTDLGGVRYCLEIDGNRVKISRSGAEPDYGAEVSLTFQKFRQGAANEHRFELPSGGDMNPVEAVIMHLVAKLYPQVFTSLVQYCSRRREYLDHTIREFDREVQFYLACLEHIERLRRTGLRFCYPTVTSQSKEIYGYEVFDLALANKLILNKVPVVSNDFYLKGPERILIVSGANQGGKTTFARTFGQLHHLASIGCPVPGKEARLFLFERLFTHFEREEDLKNLSSKLEMDLRGIREILELATSNSILIMNESFSSTTLNDALLLSRQVLQQIIERDMLCVSVTFFDELSSLGDTTVSMVGTVDPQDPTQRTFKIVRRPADGLAYAVAIAEKYRLTYERLKERFAS
jgi:DNA mismatch repair protein MutS